MTKAESPSRGWALFLAAVAGFWLAVVACSVVVRTGIRALFLEAYKIPAGSMMPTLMVGDHIFVDKLSLRRRAPERGELVVLSYPEQPAQDFVKRVILLPGDQLEVRRGHPVINGWEVPHCKVGAFTFARDGVEQEGDVEIEFLDGRAYLTFYDRRSAVVAQGPFIAKAGEFWVLGDNRNNSHDSRTWFGGQGGGVPRDLLRGSGLFVWLTSSPDGLDTSRVGADLTEPRLPAEMRRLEPELRRCLDGRPPRDKTVPPRS